MVGSLLLTQLESVCSSAQGMSLSEHSLNAGVIRKVTNFD